MEKLKEDCIDTDERLEYMKAIAEIYVPNLDHCWTNEALCPNSLYTHNHASPKFLKMRILKPAGQLEHLLSSHLSAGESANLSFNPNALRYSCGYYIYALLHILI